MFTVIKNAHIVSPDMEISCGSLLIENDKIAAVSATEIAAPAGAKVIDAEGKMAVPGLLTFIATAETITTSATVMPQEFSLSPKANWLKA